MLSAKDKIRIKNEEVFREEIKKSLTPPKSSLRKTIDFFNTSLGSWILTSLLIGVVTFTYNYFTDRNQKIKEKEASVQKINLELESRFFQFQSLLESLESLRNENNPQSDASGGFELGNSRLMQTFIQTGIYDTWITFKNGRQNEFLSIQYPEFKDRSIISLLSELIEKTDDEKQKSDLNEIRKYIIKDLLFNTRESRSMYPTKEQITAVKNNLKENVIKDKWAIKE